MNVQSHQTRKFEATVVITTKDRREGLRTALKSAVAQRSLVEIIVIDDGSKDGTHEMVRDEFPQVKIVRHDQSMGYIVRRNQAARLATTNIIFSLDDDAEFSSPNVVAQTLEEFCHQKIGAVSIPVNDVYRKTQYRFGSYTKNQIHVVETFCGTAYALRADLFLMLDGFNDFFHHQGEEGEYCARLLDCGFVTRYGNADYINHYVSPNRSWGKIAYYGARNDILFAWSLVPFPYVLLHLPGTNFKHIMNSLNSGFLISAIKGICRGYADIIARKISRHPISENTYKTIRILRKKGPDTLENIESKKGKGVTNN